MEIDTKRDKRVREREWGKEGGRKSASAFGFNPTLIPLFMRSNIKPMSR